MFSQRDTVALPPDPCAAVREGIDAVLLDGKNNTKVRENPTEQADRSSTIRTPDRGDEMEERFV